jgi:hypothetical protein
MQLKYEIRISDARGGLYQMTNGSPQRVQLESRAEVLRSHGCPQWVIDKTAPRHESPSRATLPVRGNVERCSAEEHNRITDETNLRRCALYGEIVAQDRRQMQADEEREARWRGMRGW